MARSKKRRRQHRTAVIGTGDERRALVVIPIESLDWATTPEVDRRHLSKWFPRVDPGHRSALQRCGSSASIVLDRFALTLFVTTGDDGIEWSGTHDGSDFYDAAVAAGEIDVIVTSDVDVRRVTMDELFDSPAAGSLIGARVGAFAVQAL